MRVLMQANDQPSTMPRPHNGKIPNPTIKRSRKMGETFDRSLKPFLVFARAMGLFACKFDKGCIAPSARTGQIYCIVCILTHGSYIFTAVAAEIYDSGSRNVYLRALTIFKMSLNYFCLASDILLTAFKQRQFFAILRKFGRYDVMVKQLDRERKEEVSSWWIFFVLIHALWVASVICAVELSSEIWIDVSVLKIVGRNVSYLVTTHGMMKFIGFVHLLSQRFRHLNEIIIPNVSSERNFYKHKVVTVEAVRSLHETLFDVGQDLNAIYGPLLLMWSMNQMLDILVYLYALIRFIRTSPLPAIFRLALQVFMTLCIGAICHSTSKKANDAGKLIMETETPLSIAGKKGRIQTGIYLFCNRLHFSAAGFFDVDLPMVQTMGTAVITYLVIMVNSF